MKVAVIADVHANLPALDAVLRHAAAQGAGEIWNLGDSVGYGPFPEATIQRLRAEEALSIAGNYDLKVLKTPRKLDRWRQSKDPLKLQGFVWTHAQLSAASRDWLASLPRQRRLKIDKLRLLLVHGSPARDEEPVDDSTPDRRLRELAEVARARLILCGHAHRPSERRSDGVHFFNAGSVGLPADGDPRACYGLLQHRQGVLQLTHHRVEYDVERTVAALRAAELPDAFAAMLRRGLGLDELAAAAPAPADDGEDRLASALALARSCDYDARHTEQVERLAMQLFDQLQPWHGLGPAARFWLRCGALVHDIGWCEGRAGHHLTALRLVLSSPLLAFAERERLIIGGIARYHRKAPPSLEHDHFAALGEGDRELVRATAALLRVADALDYSHRQLVAELSCEVSDRELRIHCRARGPLAWEAERAATKGQLLSEVLGRRLTITWSEA